MEIQHVSRELATRAVDQLDLLDYLYGVLCVGMIAGKIFHSLQGRGIALEKGYDISILGFGAISCFECFANLDYHPDRLHDITS